MKKVSSSSTGSDASTGSNASLDSTGNTGDAGFIKKEDIAKAFSLIRTLTHIVSPPSLPPLTAAERQKLAKPRLGGLQVVVEVEQLARQRGVEISGSSLDEMRAAVTTVQDMTAVAAECRALAQAANDSLLQALSTAWASGTLYYSILDRIAHNDPALRVKMERLNTFFARRSPLVRSGQVVSRAQRKAALAKEKAAQADLAADAVMARRKGSAETAGNGETAAGVNGTGGGTGNAVPVAGTAAGGSAAITANGHA